MTDRHRRRLFNAWLVVAGLLGAVVAWRAEEGLDKIDRLRASECVSRKNAREAILSFMERHGLDDVDRATNDRLGFDPIERC